MQVSMGILWFDGEILTPAKALSMGLLSAGACWYIIESKMAAAHASNTPAANKTTTTKTTKLLGLLQLILIF